ncbi:hypothetical protein NIES4102_24030 [Chondrocystis sp. NIES-4102]|nr:hypothetical protein NIES4102_24030 [Chondrocystis sp. NIES-4102]
MSRLKLLLLLLIIAALAIVFVQNQAPITLKFLCPDPTATSCLYKTPQLPLAVWLGIFTLAGMLTNLLSSLFSSYGNSAKQKYSPAARQQYIENDPYAQNWIDEARQTSTYSTRSTSNQTIGITDKYEQATSYERPQQPQNIERSGSNYSYKYRAATERSSNPDIKPSADIQDTPPTPPKEFVRESKIDLDKDEEDWI